MYKSGPDNGWVQDRNDRRTYAYFIKIKNIIIQSGICGILESRKLSGSHNINKFIFCSSFSNSNYSLFINTTINTDPFNSFICGDLSCHRIGMEEKTNTYFITRTFITGDYSTTAGDVIEDTPAMAFLAIGI